MEVVVPVALRGYQLSNVYSPIHSPIHPLTHSLIHPFTHSLTAHSLTHSLTQWRLLEYCSSNMSTNHLKHSLYVMRTPPFIYEYSHPNPLTQPRFYKQLLACPCIQASPQMNKPVGEFKRQDNVRRIVDNVHELYDIWMPQLLAIHVHNVG